MQLEHADLVATTHFVRELAADVSQDILSGWSTAAGQVSYKDRRDFATAVDIEVEEKLKVAIRDRFPDHGIRGEESAAERPDAEFQWLIDPIDGTKWYAGHSLLFSVSIALLHRGVPVVGVVHVPVSGQCFHATQGSGSFVDDIPLKGSQVTDLGSSILAVDSPKTDDLTSEERQWFESKLIDLTRSAYRVRMLGAGALAGCWVATGALDGFVDLTGYNKPQDVGAARLIMSEAGMRVEYVEVGVGPRRLVAAPQAVWQNLQQLLVA